MSRFVGKAFGRGRLKAGEMNGTETRFAQHLEKLKRSGAINEYWFELLTVKIATDRCSYTPDFLVRFPDGELRFYEVKGSPKIYQDDAKVKVKVTRDTCPIPVTLVFPVPKKAGGGWRFEDAKNEKD